MKTHTLKSSLISLFITVSLISPFVSTNDGSQIHQANVSAGTNLLAILLIAGILYLGYLARNKYEKYYKTRNNS